MELQNNIKMRIGIEAQRLFRAHKHGMDRVALELIRNLQKIDKQNEYFIFVKPDIDRNILPEVKNFNIVEISGGIYPIWEQFKLPKIAEAYKCDILHCTSNTAPIRTNVSLVTTLHDVIFKEMSILNLLTSDASWYQKIGNLYRRFIVGKVVKRSKKLITVSNFEKSNIQKVLNKKKLQIETVYNGVHESFTNKISKERKKIISKKYQLPSDFILHIGNTDPRKNTKRVLLSFYDYLNSYKSDLKLVIVGIKLNTLNAFLKELDLVKELQEHVILTGYVADEDLPVIFNLSSLFLFPSLREGFGIPVIEAMASGVPVITSNTSSMPEVAGDAASIVNPTDQKEITEAIHKILSNTAYKERLIKKGLERYKEFSWKNAAEKVLDLYNQLYLTQKTI